MLEKPIVLWPELATTRRSLDLSGGEFHHICRVLRLRTGDELELRDGRGLLAPARLKRVEKRWAKMEIYDLHRLEPPAGSELRLALPLLKGRRLDWVLEKGTELGVAAFHLFTSRHSVVRREKAPDRYRELISSAYCQSRRLLLPELDGPRPFAELLAEARTTGWDICWADEQLDEQGGDGAMPAAKSADGVRLAWVGPEGGFAAEERQALYELGAWSFSLGPARLRSETAALAVACRFLLPGA